MNSSQPFNKHTDDFITIQDFLSLCLSHLSWFVLSFAVIMSMALYYLFSTPDLFTSQAAIMIKEETTGNMSVQKTEGREFNNMALVQNPVSISNIQRQFTSLFLLSDVVRRMNLYNDSSEITGIAQGIRGRLVVSCDDEKSTILNIKYSDYSPKQAKEILTAIIDAFNENWIYEKNQMARSSAHFIDGRLALIEKELGQVDDSISTYKAAHQITDVSRVSDIYLDQQTSSEAEILQLSNRLSMARYVLALLKDKSSNQILLPSNIGLDNAELESQISQYNSQLLKLKSNMVGTSSQNPLILRQQNELSDVRKHILDNVNQLVRTLQMQMNAIQQFNEEAKGKVTSSPEQAKKLISVERDQKVKESLYLYLLQKKEENEISMTYTSVPTQYIDMPHGSSFPTYPNTKSILTSAFIASLLLPMAILFLRESLDNTIHSKEDIENRCSLPVIGEIPQYRPSQRKRWIAHLTLHRAKEHFNPLLVKPDCQDAINEAFRFIRSNLEFLSDNPGHKNVYIVTSMFAGSGKTFVSMNLALALAIKGRKVLLIDGDMRHASTSRTFGNKDIGLADYLGEIVDTPQAAIYHHAEYPSLSIMPVGTMPPNPTELLSNERMQELLTQVRPLYDFIIIDSPITESIADTSIIQHLTDRTLYIARAELSLRKYVSTLDSQVQAGRFKNLSIILNGINPNRRFGRKAYYYYYGYYTR